MKLENIQYKEECKARETREYNLKNVIAMFTNSSKIIEKMVNMQNRHAKKQNLVLSPLALSNIGLNAIKFVKG